MSNGETTNLGPQLESNSGPRFSIVDMGTMVGPERMDTMAVLKSELRSVYEDNSMVIRFNRAMADPGDAVIGLLKPLIILVALVVGFIGAALILETQTGSTPAAEAASAPAPAPVPEPIIAAAAIDPADEELDANLDEPIDFDEAVDEAEQAEPEEAAEPEAVEPAPEPERREVRKARKRGKRNKKNRKRHKKRKRRR